MTIINRDSWLSPGARFSSDSGGLFESAFYCPCGKALVTPFVPSMLSVRHPPLHPGFTQALTQRTPPALIAPVMNTRCAFAVWAAMFLVIHVARAADSDLNITCEKKRIELAIDSRSRSDSTTTTQQWGYTVSLENQGFKALANLDVQYIIFYKHEELGVKGPPKKLTKKGDYTIASIDSLAKTSFDTDSVTLKKTALVGSGGGYTFFTNGAKPTAADSLSGIWVRVYQNGNLYAEFAYPAGLSSTEQWQE
jgi:hypothetical protein